MRRDAITNHHIIPSSRGGTNTSRNIAFVPRRKHEHYHALFSNMTPDEIIQFLVKVFWNDNKEWVWEALKELEDS